MRVAELESLFTAKVDDFTKGADKVESRQKQIDGKVVTTPFDADVTKAEAKVEEFTRELEILRHMDASPEVDADIAKAEASLGKAESRLRAVAGLRAEVLVTADVSDAEGELDGLADEAEAAGADGGERAGSALGNRIIAALAAIPIAGSVIQIGQALGEALLSGLDNEVRGDTLAARTGLDEATVARLGTAAGEAYAANFGESIEANMDTARVAVETGLLDPKATQRDAQAVIQSLSGVAEILGEDIPNVARTASQILRTGLAKDAAGAFDLIIAGQQAGLNVSEDWLDTLNEYGTQFRVLGLEGPEALGLLSQAVQAGARDTDVAADALKEFAIRAVDDSQTTADGFAAIGLSASEMEEAIGKGGDSAAEALGRTLDGLRGIEDPIARNAAAVALFGTQAEDLGAALFAMDLDGAAAKFENLDGAADRALTTLGDNTAAKVEQAQRAIEQAADGVQGALAEAFAPQLNALADFVSTHREEIVSMLFDAAEGAVEFGRAIADGTASGVEALGDFAGSLGPLIDGLADLAYAVDSALPGDQEALAFRDWADGAVENLAKFDESTERTADQIRTSLIENSLDPAQEKIANLRVPAETAAALSDATNILSKDIGRVGFAADGSQLSLELLNGEVNTSTREGKILDNQLNRVRESLYDQVGAAAAAGESQSSLRSRVENAREAFINQVTAMGLTRGEASRLADQYGLIPEKVLTDVRANGSQAKREARDVQRELSNIKDRTVTITTIRREQVRRAGIDDNRSRAGFATGGWVYGPGTPTSDSIPANLSVGEFVVNARAAARHRDLLEDINDSGRTRLANGGPTSGVSRSITVNQYGGPPTVRDIVRADRALELLEVPA